MIVITSEKFFTVIAAAGYIIKTVFTLKSIKTSYGGIFKA